MWLWHSILIALIATQASLANHPSGNLKNTRDTTSSRGPVSQQEALILWEDGKLALTEGRYLDATLAFSRYIDRYPGAQGSLEAKYLLGQAYALLGRPEEAISPLREYIQRSGLHESSAQARILLTETYLKVAKPDEARLSVMELDRMKEKRIPLSEETLAGILWIKSKSLLALGHEKEAMALIEPLSQSLRFSPVRFSPPLKGKILTQHLKVKALQCSRLGVSVPRGKSGKHSLLEAQIQNQLDRRATCLSEGLLIFRDLLKTGQTDLVETAEKVLVSAYRDYQAVCARPAQYKSSADSMPGNIKEKRFSQELALTLSQTFSVRITQALDLMQGWTTDLSPQMKVSVKRLASTLEDMGKI